MDKSQGVEFKKKKKNEQHKIRVVSRREGNRHGENLPDWNPN